MDTILKRFPTNEFRGEPEDFFTCNCVICSRDGFEIELIGVIALFEEA